MITGLGLRDAESEEAQESAPALVLGLPPPAPRRERRPATFLSMLAHALIVLGMVRVVQAPETPPAPKPVVARHIRLQMPARLARNRAHTLPARPREMQRDRISIGPPSEQRAKELILRREDDLTNTPRGDRMTPRPPAATPVPPTEPAPSRMAAASNPSLTALPVSSLQSSVARAIQSAGDWGTPTGTGVQMGPLHFDPRGADFTRWVQHFKDEVYRNWIVPPSVLWGWGGRVGFRFVVERDGTLSTIDDVSSTGKPALDRAARNALRGSRLLPLPSDYGPAQLSIDVVFDYGPAQAASR